MSTNTLRTLREQLEAALAPAGTVLDHLPERIVPPIIIIAAGSPYVESGDRFGSYRIRHTVVLVASQGTNQRATDELDAAITATLVALDHAEWGIERVDQPTMLAHGGTHFLSTTLDVVLTVTGLDDGRSP